MIVKTLQGANFMSEEDYELGVKITSWIVFIGSWIYCIAEYGFLFGVGLGWLPSLIVAVIAGLLWPLICIIIFIFLMMVYYGK